MTQHSQPNETASTKSTTSYPHDLYTLNSTLLLVPSFLLPSQLFDSSVSRLLMPVAIQSLQQGVGGMPVTSF
jgi:hypothetical protein